MQEHHAQYPSAPHSQQVDSQPQFVRTYAMTGQSFHGLTGYPAQPASTSPIPGDVSTGSAGTSFDPYGSYTSPDTAIHVPPSPGQENGQGNSQQNRQHEGQNGRGNGENNRKKPQLRKGRIFLVGSILLVVLLLGAMFVTLRLRSNTPDVTLYNVGAQDASQYVGGGGIIYPQQQLDISYPVPERVVTVSVKPGDTVTLNQALIGLDPAQLNAQIQEASDEMNAAQAYLNSVTAGGNAIAIAQAQEQYNLAKSRYDSLVAQANSPLLHNGNLIAPLAGVVTAVNINAGEVFAANTPLLTIVDESTVIVRVNIPLTSLGQVHVGQTAQVTPSALSNLTVTGTVVSVIPQADPQTDTFQVWVAVKNPDKTLLPGMSAFVRIQNTTARSGDEVNQSLLAVPRMAVLDPVHEALVFVVRNMHAYLTHVHIVARSINTLYVDAGLQLGAQVVLTGQYNLHDGQAVHIARVETRIG